MEKGEVLFQASSWETIEEVLPDEWDKEMLQKIATDPDCKEFLSADAAMKELGFTIE